MLRDLRIQNFAIIEDLSLSFDKGLNIITGDTGAGKSILVGALGLVLGGRGSPEMIRTGADQARITARFDLHERPDQTERIRELGVDVSDGELVLHRTLSRASKNRVTANGDPCTLALMGRIGESLVDIHGQHEHHSLLSSETHIDLLDAFARVEPRVASYRDSFESLSAIRNERNRMESNVKDRERRIDFLQYQIQEIDAFQPQPGEDEQLLQERSILRNAERIASLAQESYSTLYECEGSVCDLTAQILSRLQELASLDPRTQAVFDQGEELKVRLQEMAHTLRDHASRLEPDPQRLETIEERLDRFQNLKRKYGESAEQILAFRETARSELDSLVGSETNQARLREAFQRTLSDATAQAQELSRLRKRAAKKMETELEKELGDLAMSGTRFVVRMQSEPGGPADLCTPDQKRLTAKGVDRVEFLVSPNPGEEPRPLVRIASGGELSRIMLSIKTVLAGVDRVETLIFDEIDSGIGGSVAETLGRRLRFAAAGRQVICVTHLPQVASQGESHHHISKEAHKGRAQVSARRLNGKDRIQEIARMLGGIEVTQTTMKHAKEMLELSER